MTDLTPPRPTPEGARCYVAASWRTPNQPEVVLALRAAGVSCYDFRNPPNESAFGWREIDPHWQEWTPQEYIQAMQHPRAVEGFQSDIDALRAAHICILLQPSGRSAALEFGYAAAMGKRCAVLLATGQEPELMLKVAEYFTDSLPALVEWAAGAARPEPSPAAIAAAQELADQWAHDPSGPPYSRAVLKSWLQAAYAAQFGPPRSEGA